MMGSITYGKEDNSGFGRCETVGAQGQPYIGLV